MSYFASSKEIVARRKVLSFAFTLGFEEVPLQELSPQLMSVVQDETRRGLDPTRRVVMQRRIAI
jgi:hypothetical protein